VPAVTDGLGLQASLSKDDPRVGSKERRRSFTVGFLAPERQPHSSRPRGDFVTPRAPRTRTFPIGIAYARLQS
jgi:hypothetical protein